MKMLNHKIPPPIIALLAALIMYLLAAELPSLSSLTAGKIIILVLLYFVGSVFSLGGMIAFKKAKTTLNPTNPSASTSLVQSGVYRFSRNPMYLGMLLFLAMWACYLSAWFTLLGLVFFVLYLTEFQIKPEEDAMYALFGDEFTAYCQKVRRWV